jgi:hypothetical protein
MGRRLVIAAGAVLVLAACGSAGSDGAQTVEGATSAAATSTPGSADSQTSNADNGSGAAASAAPNDPLGFGNEDATATVTIGDQRYEFGDLYCVTLGGALGAVSTGSDPAVDINVPPEDWETSNQGWDPPSVWVSGDAGALDLRAGDEVARADQRLAGLSQVDSFTTDGYHATGSATFVDYQVFGLSGTAEPISGAFEVTCPRP